MAKDAIEWLRNNDQDFEDVKDSIVGIFASITGVAKPEKLTRKSKQKVMKESVEWLRNNDPVLDEIVVDTVQAFTDMTGVSAPTSFSSNKKKEKVREVTEWLRNHDVDDDIEEEIIEM